jgi:pyruvate dehydrogenase complex dehydrogenase (E1) component
MEVDPDPTETQEWVQALDGVIREVSPERAKLSSVVHAYAAMVHKPSPDSRNIE